MAFAISKHLAFSSGLQRNQYLRPPNVNLKPGRPRGAMAAADLVCELGFPADPAGEKGKCVGWGP